ncbi:MAG: hypothetical protein FJW36_25385 [Acidobacteria bacterium]|nr:hypothetical protein [Acidobacteriota bacterium]
MKEKLIQAFGNLADSAIRATPKIALGLLLLVFGLLVAKAIEVGLRYSLKKLRVDSLPEKLGVDSALAQLGLTPPLSFLLPRIAYFLVLLLLLNTAADALSLSAVSSAIGAFFAYLPNIVAALLLLILGSTVGQFAGQTVANSAANSGIDFAPALGKVVLSAILFVCAMMAIAQLKIDTEIVRIVTSIVLGGAALAFGLAFGLGTRDLVRNITAGFYAWRVLLVGKTVSIAGETGVLSAVTPTHLILESEGRESAIANAQILDEVSRQS